MPSKKLLPSSAIFILALIFSLTEAVDFTKFSNRGKSSSSYPSDVIRRSGYPSYDAFVDSRYEFPPSPSPASEPDGDILESLDHSNVEDYTQPASNPSPVVVIPLKYGQRRQVKQRHSSSYYLPKTQPQAEYSTRRPSEENESNRGEFSDGNTFGRFSDYYNSNYDQSRDQNSESTKLNDGWKGWRGIPPTTYGNKNNMYNEMSTSTTMPPHHGDDDQSDSYHHVNEVPQHQPHSRRGWRSRNNNNSPTLFKRIVVPKHSLEEQPNYEQQQSPAPSSFDHQPSYEPSNFWHPGVPGFDSMNQEPSATGNNREEEEEVIEDHRSPHGQMMNHQDMDRGRAVRGGGKQHYSPGIKSSESRAQGVIVTGKDLQAEAGHHGGGHHGYFQYVRVPHKGAWEFGYRRGNHGHFTERHEQGHGAHFKTKVRWGDKHGGYGEHYWDYNHHGKDDHGHDDHGKHHHKFAAAASNHDQVTSSSSSDPMLLSPSPSPDFE